MRERGPFMDRLNSEMKEDKLKFGQMLHGDMAYKYQKKHDRVSKYARPMTLKGVTIGSQANVDNINMWLLLQHQLNQLIKGSNGSLCQHEFSKIRSLVTILRRIISRFLHGHDKVRPIEHNRLAHTCQTLAHHGANLGSERPIEALHQPFKKAFVACENCCTKWKMDVLIRKVVNRINQSKV